MSRPGAVLLPPEPGERLRVLEDAIVVVVPPEVRDLLLAIPSAALVVVDALAATLRQKTRTIANLSSFHHIDRLRNKLVQLAEDHGRVGRDGIRLDLRLTHDLLAEMIGSARETVTLGTRGAEARRDSSSAKDAITSSACRRAICESAHTAPPLVRVLTVARRARAGSIGRMASGQAGCALHGDTRRCGRAASSWSGSSRTAR